MRTKQANVLILLAAIASFLPVVAVDFVLDNYVRARETRLLQQGLDRLAGEIQANAYEGIGALRRVLADSPSLCTETFLANARREIRRTLVVRDVLVENGDGVQYCDALNRHVSISPLSGEVSLPGHTETLTLVRLDDFPMPVFRLTQPFGANRRVSIFVPVLSVPLEKQLSALHKGSSVRLLMPDGTKVMTAGPDPIGGVGEAAGGRTIALHALAGDIPVRLDASVPFAAVRAGYVELDVALTVAAAFLSGVLLLMLLQLARRARLPAFDLESAIRHGEFKPYYQPVIDTSSGRIEGCEVLVRWEKPNGQVIPPGQFIDYAEMSGLAVPMTLSIMKQVRADLGDLCHLLPDLKVAINLFNGHFLDTAIVDDVQAIFGNSTVEFGQLVFEITERRPLPEGPSASSVIGGLHALGARIALDDAGTGHSNLAFMQTLGVDIVKIDRIFIEMIEPGTQQVPVLDGLIGMARDLGAEIVAEGVETPEQALYVRARGVRLAQGFLFAPALKPRAFIDLACALNGEAATPAADESPAARAA